MSREKIGIAHKNPDNSPESEGIAFEIPYGEDRYGITLSNDDMDLLLDKGYAELMGRGEPLIGSTCTIDLEGFFDLPLLAIPTEINIKKKTGHAARVELGVAIVTISHVNEHRGMLLANRETEFGIGKWALASYEALPPLREPEEVFGRAEQLA